MTDPHKGNYCLECDANNGDLNDAYKYANDTKQLRDSVIGYGIENYFYRFIFPPSSSSVALEFLLLFVLYGTLKCTVCKRIFGG